MPMRRLTGGGRNGPLCEPNARLALPHGTSSQQGRLAAGTMSDRSRWRRWIFGVLVLNTVFQGSRNALDSRTTAGGLGWAVGAVALVVLFGAVMIMERRTANHRWPNATRVKFRLIDMPSLTPGQLGRWGRWRRGWAAHDGDTIFAGEVKGAWMIAFDRKTAELITEDPIVVRSDTHRGWCEVELPTMWQEYVAAINGGTGPSIAEQSL